MKAWLKRLAAPLLLIIGAVAALALPRRIKGRRRKANQLREQAEQLKRDTAGIPGELEQAKAKEAAADEINASIERIKAEHRARVAARSDDQDLDAIGDWLDSL